MRGRAWYGSVAEIEHHERGARGLFAVVAVAEFGD